MKTAMQELIEAIRFNDKECYATMFNEGIFDKALEEEKEQITKAYNSAIPFKFGEEYYNQTYNQTYNQNQ
jgi:hypothetical protein